MKVNIKSVFCLFLLAGSFLGCSKKETPVPKAGQTGETGDPGNGIPGTMTGSVVIIDSESTYYLNANTVTVSIESTTISAICNSTGTFTLSAVPPGIYNISYLEPDCGLIQQQQIVFAGNGNHFLEKVTLYKKPTYIIENAIINENDTNKGYFAYILKIPKAKKYRYGLVLLGLDSALTIEDPKSYEFVIPFQLSTDSELHHGMFPNKYPVGTKYFIRFYPYVYGTSAYYDVKVNRLRYTGHGQALEKVLSVVSD